MARREERDGEKREKENIFHLVVHSYFRSQEFSVTFSSGGLYQLN